MVVDAVVVVVVVVFVLSPPVVLTVEVLMVPLVVVLIALVVLLTALVVVAGPFVVDTSTTGGSLNDSSHSLTAKCFIILTQVFFFSYLYLYSIKFRHLTQKLHQVNIVMAPLK